MKINILILRIFCLKKVAFSELKKFSTNNYFFMLLFQLKFHHSLFSYSFIDIQHLIFSFSLLFYTVNT
jgi:hypothetical protein